MKKVNFALLAGLIFLTTAVPGYAILRDDIGYVYGKVIQHDKQNSQITVSDYYTGKDMTFTVNEDQIQMLQKDKEVALTFDLISNDVKFLRIVEPK